ncbi:MAG TPA: hypothetical protein DDY58_16245 [Terrisporobacter glycolicus]|uniref:hypothetical protein n=1 Tax=Terrisporobacter TaxID=1505652 RepID=UPI000E8E5826|nr:MULTISPECIES: hypothetical protein [Terrisporobacter]HBI93843.1 hypothetical protein [Terrisporobacter hibernicus]
MRKIKEGNVIYIIPKDKDTMDLRCSCCGTIKNELDIDVLEGIYRCECDSSSFIPQIEIEEMM